MTNLAKDQTKAYDAIMHWLPSSNHEVRDAEFAEFNASSNDWFFTLGGYAGTGKTFLMQHLVNQYEGNVICCAPTGKAAEVLKTKLPPRVKVCTVHHLLYSPIETSLSQKIMSLEYYVGQAKSAGEDVADLERQLAALVKKFDADGDEEDLEFMNAPHEVLLSRPLIIVDESSMVTMKMFNDFAETGCRVIFVGDPFQLPPVNPGERADMKALFEVHPPRVELDEIKRQALESPIIRVAHAIRHGDNPKKHFVDGECFKVDRNRIRPEHYIRAGQVICGTNKTRHGINRAARQVLGHSHPTMGQAMPVNGDKLICTMNKNDYAWINGVIMEATSDLRGSEVAGPVIDVMYQGELRPSVEVYDYNWRCNYADPKQLKDHKITDWREKQMLAEMDYAYAITCHKSQGSEWDKVLLVQDWFFADTERWLYTAVTRAKEVLLWAA
jgi:exodeoxyribonuclease-5